MPFVAQQRVHFGPYELDAHAGELYEHGLKLKLQGHPIQILAMLLERPGELITREEIQQKLWPSESETFVDFEHGLNTAVRKLRQALGDEAETPQYIETLPRRGYRFVGEIAAEELSLSPAAESPAAVADVPHTDAASNTAESGAFTDARRAPVGNSGARRRRFPYRPVLVLLLLCVLAGLAAILLSPSWFRPRTLNVVNTKRLTFNQHVGVGFSNIGTTEVYDSIQTDGRQIYFTVEADQPLRSVSVNGGDEQVITTRLSFPIILNLSPDGSTLLVKSARDPNGSAESQIWMVRVGGGSVMKLGDVKAQDAAFAPDGKTIVFAKGQDLYLTDLQGNSPAKLATVQGRAFWLRWSPDGKRLRFSVVDSKESTYRLWELTSSGSMRQLLTDWGKDSQVCCGEWAAEGKYFIFRKLLAIDQTWVLDERRLSYWREEPTLLSTGGMELGSPVNSPFEKKIFVTGASYFAEAMIRDRQSGELSSLDVGLPVYRVNYSRDGRMLAAQSLPELGPLWRISADGREKQQLTAAPLSVFMAEYSPDNQRIAMMAAWPDQPWKVYWIAADGGTLHEVPSDVVEQADPSWSPDGQSILFGQSYWTDPSIERNLYIYGLRSGKTTKLPSTTGLFSPRWSPDGRYIGALTTDIHTVVVIDLKTGEQRRLNHDESVDHPFWSPDSQWIYYDRFPREQVDSSGRRWQVSSRTVWRLNVRDDRLEEVTVRVDPLRCTRWTANGMRPDGSMLFSCFHLNRDLYALEWK